MASLSVSSAIAAEAKAMRATSGTTSASQPSLAAFMGSSAAALMNNDHELITGSRTRIAGLDRDIITIPQRPTRGGLYHDPQSGADARQRRRRSIPRRYEYASTHW